MEELSITEADWWEAQSFGNSCKTLVNLLIAKRKTLAVIGLKYPAHDEGTLPFIKFGPGRNHTAFHENGHKVVVANSLTTVVHPTLGVPLE